MQVSLWNTAKGLTYSSLYCNTPGTSFFFLFCCQMWLLNTNISSSRKARESEEEIPITKMDMQTKNHSLTVICNQLVWNLMLTFSFEFLWYFFSPLGVSSPCWIKKSQKKVVSFHPSNKERMGGEEGIFLSIFHMDVSGFSSLWTHLNTVYHLQAANAISDRLSCLVTASQPSAWRG